MGSCFSKNISSRALTPTTPQPSDLKPDPQQPHNTKDHQQVFKKEIFVIKHRVSHEIDRKSDQDMEENPSCNGAGARVRSSSCSKEEVDAILLQCGKLSRSNSAGAQNPNRRRRYSRSKRSFDFDLSTRLKNANVDDLDDVHPDDGEDDNVLNHRHRQRYRQPEARVSSPCSSSRRSSRERDFSRQQRSSSKERRISISPSRRSGSPFNSLNTTAAGGGIGGGSGTSKPAKMVSVPATDKSSSTGADQVVGGVVKRIHVKRNVSPAKRTPENHSQEQRRQQESETRDSDQMYYYRRKSLAEIDNNAARSAQPRTRKLSRDLEMNPETPSYASLLLEDIHNFHQKNTTAVAAAATAEPPSFALPECVTKACTIMEAVADLNSNTSSLFSGDKWRNPTMNKKDSLKESAAIGSREPNSVTKLGRFQRDFLDYPRKGIGRGRSSSYSIPNTTIVALT